MWKDAKIICRFVKEGERGKRGSVGKHASAPPKLKDEHHSTFIPNLLHKTVHTVETLRNSNTFQGEAVTPPPLPCSVVQNNFQPCPTS